MRLVESNYWSSRPRGSCHVVGKIGAAGTREKHPGCLAGASTSNQVFSSWLRVSVFASIQLPGLFARSLTPDYGPVPDPVHCPHRQGLFQVSAPGRQRGSEGLRVGLANSEGQSPGMRRGGEGVAQLDAMMYDYGISIRHARR